MGSRNRRKKRPPRDDEVESVLKAARRRLIPVDEDVPNDCFSEKLL